MPQRTSSLVLPRSQISCDKVSTTFECLKFTHRHLCPAEGTVLLPLQYLGWLKTVWHGFHHLKYLSEFATGYILLNRADPLWSNGYFLFLIHQHSVLKHALQLFHDRVSYHIETSLLICSANQRASFYMIGTSVMKELNNLAIIFSPNLKSTE